MYVSKVTVYKARAGRQHEFVVFTIARDARTAGHIFALRYGHVNAPSTSTSSLPKQSSLRSDTIQTPSLSPSESKEDSNQSSTDLGLAAASLVKSYQWCDRSYADNGDYIARPRKVTTLAEYVPPEPTVRLHHIAAAMATLVEYGVADDIQHHESYWYAAVLGALVADATPSASGNAHTMEMVTMAKVKEAIELIKPAYTATVMGVERQLRVDEQRVLAAERAAREDAQRLLRTQEEDNYEYCQKMNEVLKEKEKQIEDMEKIIEAKDKQIEELQKRIKLLQGLQTEQLAVQDGISLHL